VLLPQIGGDGTAQKGRNQGWRGKTTKGLGNPTRRKIQWTSHANANKMPFFGVPARVVAN